ncbi:hypothetical protein BC833DRAFT_600154 [Globomyces pollinis-pini]|nr:hypothetical protein BC833DRAFT_600154 [Globomyces pollinis-pini]
MGIKADLVKSQMQHQNAKSIHRDHQDFLGNQIHYQNSNMEQLQGPSNQSSFLAQGPALENHNWAMEFHQEQGIAPPTLDHEFDTIYTRGAQQLQSNWESEFHSQQPVHHQWSAEFNSQTHKNQNAAWNEEFNSYIGKGKGKEVDAQWEAEFQKLQIKDQNWQDEFQKFQQENQGLETQDWNEMFKEIWETSKGDTSNWMNDFENFNNDTYEELLEADPVLAPCAEYIFEKSNPYLTHPDPYAAGLELLKSQGSLSNAALAFEAAVQRDMHNDSAWMRLGTVQAENEKELPAIAALQRSVQENPQNLDALIALAVSYINEGQERESLASLERWLRTSYPDLNMPPAQPGQDLQQRLLDFFIQALQKVPLTTVDANLQIGLGLLLYNSKEYEKTVDCFTAALSVRPDDYLLWNRLGATLSNSGNSEAAIDAYDRALQLKPSFVRGRYNLGVSCMNIGCYREAAEHLLGALALQTPDTADEQKNVSTTLWDTLRRTFVMVFI